MKRKPTIPVTIHATYRDLDNRVHNVRGYYVLVEDKSKPRKNGQPQWVRYPGAGHSAYNGEEAIRTMLNFSVKRPNLQILAYTAANGIEETLTLKEMREIVLMPDGRSFEEDPIRSKFNVNNVAAEAVG
jgi:hypothetical protein